MSDRTTMGPAPYSARVVERQGRPALLVNGRPVNPMFYALTDVPGGRWSWEELPAHNLRLFGEAGFTLFQVDLFLDHVWFADGTFDVAMAQRQIRGVLEACPGAGVMIRLHVNAPKWWRDAHPEEWTHYADVPVQIEDEWGLRRIIQYDVRPVNRVSLASQLWIDEITPQVAEFCRRLAAAPEGDAVIGIQVGCGIYGEWHYWGFMHNEPDTGPAMTAYFRRWLAERYGSDEALRAAWRQPGATLATAQVPDVEARRRPKAGVFRDPQLEQGVIDYYECQHQVVADAVVHFCRVVKQHWPRPLIAGAFYGYFFSLFGRQAAGGHLALERVLDAECVDFLCGPQCYYPQSREAGGAYRSRSLIESVRLHGKLWLDEMDQEPEVKWDTDRSVYRGSVANSVGLLRRNVLSAFARGMGLWFYDFGPVWPTAAQAGWWDHPELMQEIRSLKALLDERCDRPHETEADVLLVYDTHAFYYLGDHLADPVSTAAVDWLPPAVSMSGALYDPIHLMDLERVDLDQYRAVVFANTFLLSARQRAFIRQRVAQAGRHLIFMYAPGFTDGRRLDPAHVSEVAGMRLTPIALSDAPRIVLQENRRVLSLEGWDKPVVPLLAVDDAGAEPLGSFAGTAHVAFAKKTHAHGVDWYCSLPMTDVAVMASVLACAGVHRYGDGGEVFYAGRGILGVHSKDGGQRVLTLKTGLRVEVTLEPCSTALFDSRSGERLL